MIYSQLYFKDKTKIPSVIALLFIFLIGIFFVRLFSRTAIPSKAEKKSLRRIEVANLSPNQAAVYWQTDRKDVGWVIFGENSGRLAKLVYEERDLATSKKPYLNHYVVLRDLRPDQTYFFKLISNDRIIAGNGNGVFSFKTPKATAELKNREPAYGKVIEANGAPVENAIVILRVGNSFPLAALTKTTGEWLVTLGNLYDKNSLQQITLGNKDKISIEVLNDSKISQVASDLSKISPLPQSIIIGKDFDFTGAENVLSATSVGGGASSEQPEREIDIVYPKENALIPGYNPLIKGVALPNAEVFVTIHSATEISSRVKADDKGFWKLRLSSSLSPGEHVITMKTTDRNGNSVRIERAFTIAKNGEQVLGAATPGGTLTPIYGPVETPTPTSQLYATPIPTSTFIPTQAPPRSGGDISIPVMGAASFIIVGVGLMLVF